MLNIENKKAYHDYFVEDKLECGIELKGNEVKSIRAGKVSIKDAWCQVQNNQLVIRGMHIAKWETSNSYDLLDETRERRLLAHKKEIYKLADKVAINGMTLIPLKVYLSNNKIKVLVGLCKGKKNYDKRQTIKERDIKREIAKGYKSY